MRRETALQMVERHIREGEVHILRQHQIIAELARDGHPTLAAEDLLRVFELTMITHLDHLEILRGQTTRR